MRKGRPADWGTFGLWRVQCAVCSAARAAGGRGKVGRGVEKTHLRQDGGVYSNRAIRHPAWIAVPFMFSIVLGRARTLCPGI